MESYNSHGEPLDLNNVVTTDQLLGKIRKGNDQKLEIGLGDLKVPCRLLSAVEEATLTVKAKQSALKLNPTGLKQEVFEAFEVMKAILGAATIINGAPQVPLGFYDKLTEPELSTLYDQYVSLNHTINPNLQELTSEQINSIVEEVKKKNLNSKGLYSYQLAGIGKYFLDVIIPSLQMVKEHGSL